MSAAAMACWAAGSRGVGPGVKSRVLRSMASSPLLVGIPAEGHRISMINPRPCTSHYNCPMSLIEQVQKDMTAAMRSKEELRLSTLRMMKTALKNKEIDKRAPLDEKEELQVLSTLINQRKDSIEAFEKGNRPELAKKEAEEIVYIEAYMPKAVGEEEIVAAVKVTIAEMGTPTMKDMGTVLKNVMAKFAGARVDGKVVSGAVKKELAGK